MTKVYYMKKEKVFGYPTYAPEEEKENFFNDGENYELVAELTLTEPTPENAWRATQNTESSWVQDARDYEGNFVFTEEDGLRSMMIGDKVSIGTKMYICDNAGWIEA